MKGAVAVALVWLACAPLTFGMLNASHRQEWSVLISPRVCRERWPALADSSECSRVTAERNARGDCAFAAGMTIAGPITLVVSFLATSFAYDGLSYDCGVMP